MCLITIGCFFLFHISFIGPPYQWFSPKMENHSPRSGKILRTINGVIDFWCNVTLWCIVWNCSLKIFFATIFSWCFVFLNKQICHQAGSVKSLPEVWCLDPEIIFCNHFPNLKQSELKALTLPPKSLGFNPTDHVCNAQSMTTQFKAFNLTLS